MFRFVLVLCILGFTTGHHLAAGTQIRHVDFHVQNNADQPFDGVILLDAADIYALIPDFDGHSCIATTTHAPDLAADLQQMRAFELISQPLDRDRDGRPHAIAVKISLDAGQGKVVTIHAGPEDRIIRLRDIYPDMTGGTQLPGHSVLIESSSTGYVISGRTPEISVFGKQTSRMISRAVTQPGYDRSVLSALGQWLPGIHAGMHMRRPDGSVVVPGSGECTLTDQGPLVATVRAVYTLPADSLVVYYSLAAGRRWVQVEVEIPAAWQGSEFFGELPIRTHETVITNGNLIATLAGSPATALAVHTPEGRPVETESNAAGHRLLLRPDAGRKVRFAFAAWWELEHAENVVEQHEVAYRLPLMGHADVYGTTGRILVRPPRLQTKEDFQKKLQADQPWPDGAVTVTRLSDRALTYTELLPRESVGEHSKKSYTEALNLTWQRLRDIAPQIGDRFWITSTDDGKPRASERVTWGAGYWVDMLWDAFKLTGEPQYREMALRWNGLIDAEEPAEMHATGLVYWLSSVRSYRETGDRRWRDSAMKCADMSMRILDPVTGMYPEYGPGARREPDNPYHPSNYIKIDAMIGIPILWWAAEETHDRRYYNAALRHSNESLRYFVEADGAVMQQGWFDNKTGALLGIGTSQGYGGNSRWARGLGWGLDGFYDVYMASHDLQHLEALRRMADWMIANNTEDYVPWYDFDDQAVFWRYRDTGTASICAYALLRLSDIEPDAQRAERYRSYGLKLMHALMDRYLAPVSPDDRRPPGMLTHSCYTKPNIGETSWGTYYFAKALVWLKQQGVDR